MNPFFDIFYTKDKNGKWILFGRRNIDELHDIYRFLNCIKCVTFLYLDPNGNLDSVQVDFNTRQVSKSNIEINKT